MTLNIGCLRFKKNNGIVKYSLDKYSQSLGNHSVRNRTFAQKYHKYIMQSIVTNRNIQLTFVGVLLFIFFLGNYQFSLWDNAESIVALKAQQIVKTNDWTPVFSHFIDGFRVHPLQIWETALSYKIFGVSEFATRFPALLYVILTLVTLLYFVRRSHDEKTGILAAVILSTSFLLPTLAKINLAESGLLFYATVMFGAFSASLKSKNTALTVVFWSAAILSTFHGGFIAIIPFVGTWLLLFFVKKDWRTALFNIQPYLIIIAIIPIIAWALMNKVNVTDLNTNYNAIVSSASAKIGRQSLLLLLGFLPWIALLPASFVRLSKNILKKENDALLFGGWIFFGFLLFEILPTSIQMPSVVIFPVIAILMAQQFLNHNAACERFQNAPINEHLEVRVKKAGLRDENIMKTSQLLGVIAVFVVTFILSMIGYNQGVGILRTGFVGMILWITSFIVAIGLYARNANMILYGAVSGGLLFVLFAYLLVIPVLEPARSFTKRTAASIEKTASNEIFIYANPNNIPPSLHYYLNNLSIENDKTIIHFNPTSDLTRLYQSDNNYTLILDKQHYKSLKETPNFDHNKVGKTTKIEGVSTTNRKTINYWIIQK